MLEESRMDKKSLNRSTLPQSRASAIDCKKNSELTNKPWPRNNKKREGPGNAPKNEASRKNAPAQRGRGQVDRRPRARGGASNFLVGGTQNTGLEDEEEPEIGSVFVPGSKKQNLNHLLNFMYPSRGPPDRSGEHRGAVRRAPPRAPHRLDHDLYLRANCQFVLKEDGDYSANLLDPDVPIKWEQVEEIVVRSGGRSECPVCLGAPAAGRAARCGHVYCWACALHLAAVSERAPAPPPCPVCAAPLPVQEMRPTRVVQCDAQPPQVTMRLVRRLRGSNTVETAPARGEPERPPAPPILPLEAIGAAPYAKFFTANKQQVRYIIARERKEIQDQILDEIDTTEIVYLEQALELLKAKEEELNCQYQQPKPTKELPETSPIVYEKETVAQTKIDWFDMTDEGSSHVETIQEQVEDLAISLAQSKLNPDAPNFVLGDDNLPEEFPLIESSEAEMVEETSDNDNVLTDIDKQNQAKYFYFYQAEDGQQVFLHGLNVRVLNASWGALAAAPLIIKGRVLHRENLSLSEQTRKHMPYTAHLPLYCSFDIVELDLQPPYVTKDALMIFADEIERRARARARHERDEKRRERAYRRTLEGPPRPDFSSELLFPAPAPAPSFSPPCDVTCAVSIELMQPTVETSPAAATSPSGLSFAKMASTSGTWRVRKTAPPPPPPPDPEEGEGGAPRTLSLSDAIEAALHAAPAPAHASGGKKKKNKQKVLFATGMQRAA